MRVRSRLGIVIAGLVALATFSTPAASSQCIGVFDEDFSAGTLSPLWTDASDPGCSVAEAGGRLVCTPGNVTAIAAALMDQGYRRVCGDFDITVEYSLDSYPAPSVSGGRFHGVSVVDAATSLYVAGIQRYSQVGACITGTSWYKTWLTTPSCPPSALYYETTDTQGKFRIARTGATVRTYYWTGTDWFEAMSGGAPTGPVLVLFQSGTNGTLAVGHTASFDNLSIVSSPLAPAMSAPIAVAGALLLGSLGILSLRRSRRASRA